MTTPVTTRPSGQLTLKDRLSRLNFHDACKLLGPDGAKLIQKGANEWESKLDEANLGEDEFRLRLPQSGENGQDVMVKIKLQDDVRKRLHFACSQCFQACMHV